MVDSGNGYDACLLGFRQALDPGPQLSAGRCACLVAKQVDPAVNGTDPGDEFPHVRRLGNEVVGAKIPANHLIRFVQHSGQHDDSAVPWGAEHGNE